MGGQPVLWTVLALRDLDNNAVLNMTRPMFFLPVVKVEFINFSIICMCSLKCTYGMTRRRVGFASRGRLIQITARLASHLAAQ